jgi:hypothetical protein
MKLRSLRLRLVQTTIPDYAETGDGNRSLEIAWAHTGHEQRQLGSFGEIDNSDWSGIDGGLPLQP